LWNKYPIMGRLNSNVYIELIILIVFYPQKRPLSFNSGLLIELAN